MKVVLLQNTIINHKRKVAGDIVELEAEVAKNFCEALLAAPYAEIENGELVSDADPEVLVAFAEAADGVIEEITTEASETAENSPAAAAEEITPEQPEEPEVAAGNKGKKKGQK
jgi:hypothetical protein